MIDLDVIGTAIADLFAAAIRFAPILLTALLILAGGWLLSRLVATAVRRLALRFDLEGIVERAGLLLRLRQAGISRPVADMLGSFVFWIIFLNFLAVALETIGLAAAVEPLRNLIALLPRLLTALITFVVGALVAQFLGRAVQATAASMGIDFHEGLGRLTNMLLLVIIVIIVMEQLGLDTTVLNDTFINILTIVVAGVALAFGLGGRAVARNVLAGYYARETFSLGDRVEIDGEVGVIDGIGTLNTEIETDDGRLVVPNTRLTEAAVKIKNR